MGDGCWAPVGGDACVDRDARRLTMDQVSERRAALDV
jgi:hypothetical protein